jgi:hypothetical protein
MSLLPAASRPSGRSLTFRLQNIPSEIDGQAVKDALAEGNLSNLLQYSFARVDDEVSCATVTFKSTPQSFREAADGSYHNVNLKIPSPSLALPITVDIKFEGMTTLYHPPRPSVECVLHFSASYILKSKRTSYLPARQYSCSQWPRRPCNRLLASPKWVRRLVARFPLQRCAQCAHPYIRIS